MDHYSKLAMIKVTADESVEEYVFCADTHLSVLQAAQFKFDMEVVVRAVIEGLHVTNRGTNLTGDKRYHGIYVVHQAEV